MKLRTSSSATRWLCLAYSSSAWHPVALRWRRLLVDTGPALFCVGRCVGLARFLVVHRRHWIDEYMDLRSERPIALAMFGIYSRRCMVPPLSPVAGSVTFTSSNSMCRMCLYLVYLGSDWRLLPLLYASGSVSWLPLEPFIGYRIGESTRSELRHLLLKL